MHREARHAGRVDRRAIYLSLAGGDPATQRLPMGADYTMLPEQWSLPLNRWGSSSSSSSSSSGGGGGGGGPAEGEATAASAASAAGEGVGRARDWRAELFWRDLEGISGVSSGGGGGGGGGADQSLQEEGGGKLMGKLVWWRQSDVLRTLLLEHWERREWRRFTGELAIGAYHLLMNWAYSEK